MSFTAAVTGAGMLVAVYGTLRRGEKRHHVLTAGGAEYVGIGDLNLWYPGGLGGGIAAPVALCDTGWGFPALCDAGLCTPSSVRAEVYAVGPALLARLDQIEDVPHLYRRVEVGLTQIVRADGQRDALLTAHAYLSSGTPAARSWRHILPTESGIADWRVYRQAAQKR